MAADRDDATPGALQRWRLAGRGAMGGEVSRVAPRLRELESRWSARAGLAAQATPDQHADMLRRYFRHLRDHVATYPVKPRFAVVIRLDRPDPDLLAQALGSLAIQLYPDWTAILVGESGAATAVIDDFVATHPNRVRWVPADGDETTLADPARELGADYLTFLGQHDRLLPQSLAEVVRAVNEGTDEGQTPQLLYSDERPIDAAGVPAGEPVWKPDWSPLLLLGDNYFGHLVAVSLALLTQVGQGAWPTGTAAEYDLWLRASEHTTPRHIPHVLYQRRLGSPAMTVADGTAAVRDACRRRGLTAEVSAPRGRAPFRIDFAIAEPLVSVVIPSFNHPDLLARCVDSVLNRSTYANLEVVIVDNGSDDPALGTLYAELAVDPRVRILQDPGYFNFARLINRGAADARGEFLVLMNNDTEVITPDWLEVLLGIAGIPGVGAVGPALLFANGAIQHVGLIGAARAGTAHVYSHRPPGPSGGMQLDSVMREVLAVTGAVMMIRASTFAELGGLDEVNVPNDCGDVDLCLRLRRAGLSTVFTPHARLYHFESQTRRRSFESHERYWLLRVWPDELLNDPYLNANLRRSEIPVLDEVTPLPEIPPADLARWCRTGTIDLLGT